MSREELTYNAKLAEHSERYADMIQYIKDLVTAASGNLNEEERTLLSVAYKQAVGEKRQAWRAMCHYEEKLRARNSEFAPLVEEYKGKIKSELSRLCEDVAAIVDNTLLGQAESDEVKVFYHKMKGDYFRYEAETDNSAAVEKSHQAYQAASQLAENLAVNHPVKIGLALNFSVFFYEVLKDKQKACDLAKKTFDDALPQLEELEERAYKEATSILGLIKDNLTIWTSEDDE